MSRKKPATALLKIRPPADVLAILKENSPDGDFRAFGEEKALALLEEWARGATVKIVALDEDELAILQRNRPNLDPLTHAMGLLDTFLSGWLADRRREQKLKDLAKIDPALLREALGLDPEGEDAGYGQKTAPPGWEGAKSRGEAEEADGGSSETETKPGAPGGENGGAA